MSGANVDALALALVRRERQYSEAIDRLRGGTGDAQSDAWALREAVELVRCLRRLVQGRTVAEIHKAFGAPGDFGYETPIGDALSRLYRGEP